MNTIEERAKKASIENSCWNGNDTFLKCIEFGYVLGEKDQHDIEIDKLKDVMNSLWINTHVKAEIIKLMNQ